MALSRFFPARTKRRFAKRLPLKAKHRRVHMSVAILRKLYQPIAIAVALAFVYFTVLLKLGGDWWNDENYSHGLLIPFIIGYILWQERKVLSEAQTRPAALWGAVGVGVSLLLLWAGVAGAELFVQRASLVLMIASVVI